MTHLSFRRAFTLATAERTHVRCFLVFYAWTEDLPDLSLLSLRR